MQPHAALLQEPRPRQVSKLYLPIAATDNHRRGGDVFCRLLKQGMFQFGDAAMKYLVLMVVTAVMGGCGAISPSVQQNLTVSDEEYREIQQRILDRIMELKTTHSSLAGMTSPLRYEYNVAWVLADPAEPHGKLNSRYAAFGRDGYWFSLQFYCGQWQGAAVFRPVEFGDLKLWFRYGHEGNTSVIAAITAILREESKAFRERHP